jgi:hypothetical protein
MKRSTVPFGVWLWSKRAVGTVGACKAYSVFRLSQTAAHSILQDDLHIWGTRCPQVGLKRERPQRPRSNPHDGGTSSQFARRTPDEQRTHCCRSSFARPKTEQMEPPRLSPSSHRRTQCQSQEYRPGLQRVHAIPHDLFQGRGKRSLG